MFIQHLDPNAGTGHNVVIEVNINLLTRNFENCYLLHGGITFNSTIIYV